MTEQVRFVHAINRALGDAMAADAAVMVLGEDVANAGGSFKATRGLLERFGEARVRDTPISEAAIVGAAVGAAMTGLKPVVEIMFMDFATLAMDAIVNQAAKARFMFGGQTHLPLVVRMPHGGGLNAGPQHSQCLEAWFAHVPGIKVVCPSNAVDAYGLLRSAIDDPDPVVFVENKALYAQRGELDAPPAHVPIGAARIARAGEHATVVAYGAAVNTAMSAAAKLAEQGIEVEVIDLRTLQPWDKAAVLASVAKTHYAVIVHEAVRAFGIGAEIAATISDEGFDELDGPVTRVGAPFMPVPYSRPSKADTSRMHRRSSMPSAGRSPDAMLHEILMPKLGLTMTEGSISEWKAVPGDAIKAGDVVLVVETDKAAHDVESELGGVMLEIVVAAGETVPVGTVLARIDSPEADARPEETGSAHPIAAAIEVAPRRRDGTVGAGN